MPCLLQQGDKGREIIVDAIGQISQSLPLLRNDRAALSCKKDAFAVMQKGRRHCHYEGFSP